MGTMGFRAGRSLLASLRSPGSPGSLGMEPEVPALETEAAALAALHAQAEYARERLPDNTLEVMRTFWERLERVVEAPLSA